MPEKCETPCHSEEVWRSVKCFSETGSPKFEYYTLEHSATFQCFAETACSEKGLPISTVRCIPCYNRWAIPFNDWY
jgi:hypothetical protein